MGIRKREDQRDDLCAFQDTPAERVGGIGGVPLLQATSICVDIQRRRAGNEVREEGRDPVRSSLGPRIVSVGGEKAR
jgi:hypothetical protein